MPPLRYGDRFSVVQGTAPKMIFVKLAQRDESVDDESPQDITGWTIQIMVKRRRLDPDTAAFFSAAINPPAAAASNELGTPLSPTLGQFGWDFESCHTFNVPGIYAGEISFWTAGMTPGTDAPYERIPIEWEIIQRTDL